MSTTVPHDLMDIEESGVTATRPSSRRSLLRRALQWGSRVDARLDPSDVVAVLEQAREIIATGWVQGRWFSVSRQVDHRSSRRSAGGNSAPESVAGACVVGAIALAVQQRHPRASLAIDAGPAIDHVWDATQDAVGLGMPTAAGRAWPQEVRLSRLRDIARWNDAAGRTKAQALAVLDGAISHAIMSAMRRASASSS